MQDDRHGQPRVTVIGRSHFYGVPSELLPPPTAAVSLLTFQDNGSDGARLVECAGRTCYDSYGKGRSSEKFHAHILESGHGSVLEHSSTSFYLAGLSRGCTHELVRHRAGCAVSQRSTRFVDESQAEYAWHPLIKAYAEEQGELSTGLLVSEALDRLETQTSVLYSQLVDDLQTWLLAKGIDRQTARKQARGAARGCLGNALSSEMVWTANLRALRNFIEQRASAGADAEIRLLANRVYEAALKETPEFFSDYERRDCSDGIGYALVTVWRKV